MWLPVPQLHITITMVHLDDPEKLQLAKNVLQSLQGDIQEKILGATDGDDPIPLNLTLKGLHAGFGDRPDIEDTRIAHIDIRKDENYDLLVKIGHEIISAFLEKGVMKKKDLSHITYNR